MSFGGSPSPPPPPPPPPTPPHFGNSDATKATQNYTAQQRGGLAQTIATSGSGDTSKPNLAYKSLLGE